MCYGGASDAVRPFACDVEHRTTQRRPSERTHRVQRATRRRPAYPATESATTAQLPHERESDRLRIDRRPCTSTFRNSAPSTTSWGRSNPQWITGRSPHNAETRTFRADVRICSGASVDREIVHTSPKYRGLRITTPIGSGSRHVPNIRAESPVTALPVLRIVHRMRLIDLRCRLRAQNLPTARSIFPPHGPANAARAVCARPR